MKNKYLYKLSRIHLDNDDVRSMEEAARVHLRKSYLQANNVESAPESVTCKLHQKIMDFIDEYEIRHDIGSSHSVDLHTDPDWSDKMFAIFVYCGNHAITVIKNKDITHLQAYPGCVFILDPLVPHCVTPNHYDANIVYHTLELPRLNFAFYEQKLKEIIDSLI